MKNKLLLSTVILGLAFLPAISSAEEAGAGTSANVEIQTETSTTNNTSEMEARARLEAQKRERAQMELKKKENLRREMEQKKETIKGEMEKKKETIKDKIDEKKETVKGEIEKRKENAIGEIQERLHDFAENVVERLNAATARLEQLATRIQSRITKLEAENIDTTKAKELLATAKTKIEIAKGSVASIDLVNTVTISTTTATSTNKDLLKERFQEVKNQIEKAKKDIKTAHAALVDVINNLKPGLNKDKKPDGSATSTATSTNH